MRLAASSIGGDLVEGADDAGNGLVVAGAKAQAGLSAGGALDEQLARAGALDIAESGLDGGNLQRFETHHPLSAGSQRLPAGRHHGDVRAGVSQGVDEAAYGEAQVLTVVQHHQPPVDADQVAEQLHRRLAAGRPEAEGHRDDERHIVSGLDTGQTDERAGATHGDGRRKLDAESCLAHPTGSDDRDHWDGVDKGGELGQLVSAIDQRRRRPARQGWQRDHRRNGRGWRVERAGCDLPLELVELTGRVEPSRRRQPSPEHSTDPHRLGRAALGRQR